MPANIPSPIVGAGGGQRQNPLEALLLSLAQGMAGGLLQRGFDKFMPQTPPETPAERQRSGAEQYAQQQLMNMPGTAEHTSLQGAAASGLGNATVPTSDVVGLSALPRAASTAPERLAMLQEERRLREEEARKVRLRERAIKSTPAELRPVMAMILNAQEAGAPESSINDILPQLLPPTEAEIIDRTYKQAQTEEIRLRLRQAQSSDALRAEIAGKLGLQADTVTDGMMTEWMRQVAPDKPTSPNDMAERIATSLISRTVTDLMGNANPAFNVDEALVRTEDAMKAFVPGFTLTLTDEQRQRVEMQGVLRAAVAREKQLNPRITAEELSARLGPRFMGDFPLAAGAFEDMLTEALKSNLLTGL